MSRRKGLDIPPQKITYTLIGRKQALAYVAVLIDAHYVFTCLPYDDCVRIETYIAAPAPRPDWLAL